MDDFLILLKIGWGGRGDSNPRPLEPQSSALTTELRPPLKRPSSMVRYITMKVYKRRIQSKLPCIRRSPVRGQAGLQLAVASFDTIQASRAFAGAPGGIRTPDPLLRRQLLYPAELLALCKERLRRLKGIFSDY